MRLADVAIISVGDSSVISPDVALAAEQPPALTSEELSMDIHKPKPIHSLPEFLSEISVIVLGILIALLLEQCVEAWRSSEKTYVGESSIRAEISDQLAYATVFLKLKPGLDAQIAKLETAAVTGDHAQASRLAYSTAPFEMRPWSGTAWDAAASEQVVSRLDPNKRRNYQILHRQATSMTEIQGRLKDNYATLLTARLPTKGDTIVGQQINAAEHIRSDSDLGAIIAGDMIARGSKMGLRPTPERLTTAYSDFLACKRRAQLTAESPHFLCS